MHFFHENLLILVQVWEKTVPNRHIKISHLGSNNGLLPNRQQAIIWTNDGLVRWQIHASPGPNVTYWQIILPFLNQVATAWVITFLLDDISYEHDNISVASGSIFQYTGNNL